MSVNAECVWTGINWIGNKKKVGEGNEMRGLNSIRGRNEDYYT